MIGLQKDYYNNLKQSNINLQQELDTYNACRRINDFRLGSKNHTDSVLCEETFVKSIKLGIIQKVSCNSTNKLFTDSLLTEIVNY
jgi:hypothetical protein